MHGPYIVQGLPYVVVDDAVLYQILRISHLSQDGVSLLLYHPFSYGMCTLLRTTLLKMCSCVSPTVRGTNWYTGLPQIILGLPPRTVLFYERNDDVLLWPSCVSENIKQGNPMTKEKRFGAIHIAILRSIALYQRNRSSRPGNTETSAERFGSCS